MISFPRKASAASAVRRTRELTAVRLLPWLGARRGRIAAGAVFLSALAGVASGGIDARAMWAYPDREIDGMHAGAMTVALAGIVADLDARSDGPWALILDPGGGRSLSKGGVVRVLPPSVAGRVTAESIDGTARPVVAADWDLYDCRARMEILAAFPLADRLMVAGGKAGAWLPLAKGRDACGKDGDAVRIAPGPMPATVPGPRAEAASGDGR